jgi:hypothetical protein
MRRIEVRIVKNGFIVLPRPRSEPGMGLQFGPGDEEVSVFTNAPALLKFIEAQVKEVRATE